jgi:polyketide cyclase/dehydrase/lipid transport protein
MPKVSATIEVDAAPEVVFDYLADYRNIPKLQPQFEWAKIAGETVRGLGAVMELHGSFHGLPLNTRERIIAFSPPHRLVSIGEGAILSRTTWELRPLEQDGGQGKPTTMASVSVEYKAGGPMGGMFTSWAISLFHKEIQAMTDESLRRLQARFANGVE